ncbi:MAG: hypothetical protein ACRC11_09255, partial [Xenococcaceae cyanobacterium]
IEGLLTALRARRDFSRQMAHMFGYRSDTKLVANCPALPNLVQASPFKEKSFWFESKLPLKTSRMPSALCPLPSSEASDFFLLSH